MYRIAVCDDEEFFLKNLKKQIEENSIFQKEHMTVQAYLSGEELLKNAEQGFDLILLDMQMEGLNGYETAKCLREQAKNDFVLGFITGYMSPKPEDFRVRPSLYMIKSTASKEFEEDISSLLQEMIDKTVNEYFICTSGAAFRKINIKDILYITKSKNGTEVTFSNKYAEEHQEIACKCSKKMSRVYEELADKNFAFVQDNFLTNLDYVTELKGRDILYENSMCVTVSRKNLETFRKRLIEYHKGFMR